MGRHEVELADEDSEWLRRHVLDVKAVNLGAFLRDLVLQARKASEGQQPATAGKKLTEKQRFLAQVRKVPELALACDRANISWAKVEGWKACVRTDEERKAATGQPCGCAGCKFTGDLEFSQMVFLGELMETLVETAAGRIKGNPNAAGWLLNALHPLFGRVKAEVILRVLDPLVKAYGQILLDELGGGEDAKASIARADEKFGAVKHLRMTDFT